MEKKASGDRDILFEVHSIICKGENYRKILEVCCGNKASGIL